MLSNQTDGERIIVSEKTLWMDEVATYLEMQDLINSK
ncbi:MAG: hypothetical protein CM1200mP1_00040 [Candidatus Neomarinimicrobiota bacterium]|nr:MAG: hypothetical protein CM1200mP1_00040 [Candidatus Neomarinimicrobiota bacterium]